MSKKEIVRKVDDLLITASIAETLGDRRTAEEALTKAILWEAIMRTCQASLAA